MTKLKTILPLTVALLLLAPGIQKGLSDSLGSIPAHWQMLTSTNMEERKLALYGNRDGIGYGYLRHIVDGIPDPAFFPVTRYPTYSQNTNMFFPGQRNNIDDRILVGISLSPEEVVENLIAPTQKAHTPNQGANTSLWTFVTGNDYDQMSALQLYFPESTGAQPIALKITLLYSPTDPRLLGTWTHEGIAAQGVVTLHLQPPLDNFSFKRGATPFLLILEISGAAANPNRVDIAGIKVNLSDYVIYHQEGPCFAAIKKSFVEQIEKENLEPWKNYLRSIKNV